MIISDLLHEIAHYAINSFHYNKSSQIDSISKIGKKKRSYHVLEYGLIVHFTIKCRVKLFWFFCITQPTHLSLWEKWPTGYQGKSDQWATRKHMTNWLPEQKEPTGY